MRKTVATILVALCLIAGATIVQAGSQQEMNQMKPAMAQKDTSMMKGKKMSSMKSMKMKKTSKSMKMTKSSKSMKMKKPMKPSKNDSTMMH